MFYRLAYSLSWAYTQTNVYSAVVGWIILNMSVRSILHIMFKFSISFFDTLLRCSIHYAGGIELFNYFCQIVYFSFQFCLFCFMYFRALMLWAYMFIIIVTFWWFDTFIIKCPLYLYYHFLFIFKVYCIWHYYSYSSFPWLLFVWYNFFHSFTFSLICIFESKVFLL